MSIIDKDKDNKFSFDDFVNNFPRYNSKQVEKFFKRNGSGQCSAARSESIESIASLNSDTAEKEVDKFKMVQKLRRT